MQAADCGERMACSSCAVHVLLFVGCPGLKSTYIPVHCSIACLPKCPVLRVSSSLRITPARLKVIALEFSCQPAEQGLTANGLPGKLCLSAAKGAGKQACGLSLYLSVSAL